MEVKQGYKQTDVGIIPEDWEIKPLSDLTKEIGDGIHATPEYVNSSDYFFINGNNLLNGQIVITENTMCVGSTEYRRLRKSLDNSTILMSINGTIGNLAFYKDEKVVLGKSAAYISANQKASKEFLYYTLQSNATKTFYENELTGTTIRNLSLGSIRNTPIPHPTTLVEQEAIAEALSDADALIEAVEQLLAKKRQIKQGAMSELLTGKRRLSGFSDEWEVKTFGELFNFSGGFTASRDQLSSEGYCYLHYGDIHMSKKTFVDVQAEFQDIPKLNIPLKKVSTTSLLEDGDIVFVDASEDDEGASRHVVIINPNKIPYISGLHTIVAKSKTDELEKQYRRYCFQTREVKNQFRFYAVGTKVSGISKTNIAKINLPVPSIPEQTAIAEILSDMDAEISALEEKLVKARQVKAGMMSELLTGKIRLNRD